MNLENEVKLITEKIDKQMELNVSLHGDLESVGAKIGQYLEDSKRRSYYERLTNLSFVSWGFSLATTSLAVASPKIATIAIAIAFVILGALLHRRSRKFEAVDEKITLKQLFSRN